MKLVGLALSRKLSGKAVFFFAMRILCNNFMPMQKE